jgi:ribonuclease Z
MSLVWRVLGGLGCDNALYVSVDTGQRISRLLFDCGDGCPHALETGELLEVDHLFFSHFHMDHISGFDLFFRLNFNRNPKPVNVWVPPGGAEVMHHRFRGFEWNLVGSKESGVWLVHELARESVRSFRFEAKEGFRIAHSHAERPRNTVIVEGEGYTVEAYELDHGTVSMGYIVREAPRVNVDTTQLATKGFAPGPWVKRLRGPVATPGEVVNINGTEHSLAALQAELLVHTPGESVAYLTDFRLNEATAKYLAEHLRGVTTMVCESQYRAADVELAEAAKHSTATEVANLAMQAGVGRLILFHISPRYIPDGYAALLTEARAIFPNVAFPEGW